MKLKSLMDIRKYKDAIMWGAGVADEKLPTSFYDASNKYLESCKKTDEKEKRRQYTYRVFR